MDKEQKYIAKTLYGLEDVLVKELENIGAKKIKKLNRAVLFYGNNEVLYRANLQLRTALKILKPIKSFTAKNEYSFYKNVYSIDWTKIFKLKQTFAINTTVHSKYFNHSKYIAYKTKDAIVDLFRKKKGERPNVDSHLPNILIDVHVSEAECSISLDSSGKPLNQRGYRDQTGVAPLNEVLAAGMIMLTGWDGNTHFVDPMCGSGTILIEAGMIAKNMAPNLQREAFAFMQWKDYDAKLFNKIKSELQQNIVPKPNIKIIGNDISSTVLRIARRNLNRLGMARNFVELTNMDFKDLKPPKAPGLVVTNPPYNVRIELEDSIEFYKEIGDAFKNNFKNYDCWVISADLEALKHLGLKAEQKIKLINGKLDASFNHYKIY